MKSKIWIGLTVYLSGLILIGCAVSYPAAGVPEPGLTSIGTLAATSFGVVIDANMKIVGVDSGSVAEQAGVQVGDRIVRIRNVAITSGKQARMVYYSENLSKPIPLELERKGQSVTLDVLPYARQRDPNPSGPIPTVTPVPQDLYYF